MKYRMKSTLFRRPQRITTVHSSEDHCLDALCSGRKSPSHRRPTFGTDGRMAPAQLSDPNTHSLRQPPPSCGPLAELEKHHAR